MDVPHHTHHASGEKRKKWFHYFFEFIMLFLAVYFGFLTENWREHLVEHKREKQYIRSLARDIRTDSTNSEQWLRQYSELIRNCDTLLAHFSEARAFGPAWAGSYFKLLHGFPDFIYTDQTMQQLKNAGGLRLIRDGAVIDSIIAYDAAVRDLLIEETVNSGYFEKLTVQSNNLLSYRNLKTSSPLLSVHEENKGQTAWIRYDPEEMERLYNLVYKYRDEMSDFVTYLAELKERGGRLLGFLKKEYDLE